MRFPRLLPSSLPALPWWARAADALTLTILLVSPIVAATGGFRVTIYGLLVSVRSVDRLILYALVISALRHWAATGSFLGAESRLYRLAH